MSPLTLPLTKTKHAEIANDLPTVSDLLTHHCIYILSAYANSPRKDHQTVALLAAKACTFLGTLVSAMAELAEEEHPGADFLTEYPEKTEWGFPLSNIAGL